MVKLKILACEVLKKEILAICRNTGISQDITFIAQDLHNTPEKLHDNLQEHILKIHNSSRVRYDFILLLYGLCSNALSGLYSLQIPLAVPRAHDCITYLLGSKERYFELFGQNPGTYWLSPGWIDAAKPPSEDWYHHVYTQYASKYGEENARFLMETEHGWINEYKRCSLICWPDFPPEETYREFSRRSALFFGWTYAEVEGSSTLLRKLLCGSFSEQEVLLVPPGMEIAPSYDEKIIKAVDRLKENTTPSPS